MKLNLRLKKTTSRIFRMLQDNNKKVINDQKEELAAKHLEIEELRSSLVNFELKSSSSISEELKMANLELEKGRLEIENKNLRFKVEKLEKTRKERSLQHVKMEEVSVRMQTDL